MLKTLKIISGILLLLLLITPGIGCCYTELAIATATEIAYESALPSIGIAGYPLPLAASWDTGCPATGWTPDYMVGLVEEGHHVLPSFQFVHSSNEYWQRPETYSNYYEAAMRKCKDLGLPIGWISTQWESILSTDSTYNTLPAPTNPNVVQPDGTVQAKVSPFGPSSHWQAVGKGWTNSPTLTAAQATYPSPPLVIFLSNNEHPKLKWYWEYVSQDSKYLALYDPQAEAIQTEAFRREVIGDGYINLYGALIAAMRGELSANWANASRFIAYEANQDRSFGRWGGWTEDALHIENRISPWPSVWDGTSPSYYSDNWSNITDYQVFSAQIESMNWVFQKKEALLTNPDYIFEMSVWDGASGTSNDKRSYYESLGQTYNPTRYKGWIQYGMWITRPRIVREFRANPDTVETQGSYWLALVDAVDMVWKNSTLKRFWRSGTLVENETYGHPYQIAIPPEYQSTPRNFLLTTNQESERPWDLYSHIDVFSLALVIGDSPNREWLVYLHSPLKVYSGVQVAIPGYGQIIANSSPGGSFYHVVENTKEVTEIQQPDVAPRQQDVGPVQPPINLRIVTK